MVQVSSSEFDYGSDGGDNNLTEATQFVDGSTSRITAMLYDWRDRRIATDGEIDFYEQVCYDNLDRVIRTDRRDTTANGNLIARSRTFYDDRGRVYQSIRYGVDPATGIVGNGLVDNSWFDAAGNVLKSQPSGSQMFSKSVYDGIGRVAVQYSGYNLSDSSYANASEVSSDTILEQSETTYDDASNVIETIARQRFHNASGEGPLNGPTGSQPLARVTYSASWQDGIGRVVASADYGTNGGSDLSRPDTIPSRSDTCLVTSTIYDSTGQVQTTTDPMGTVTFFAYDAVGREVQRILNYRVSSSSSSGSSSGSSGANDPCSASDDTNVTVLTAYNDDGNVRSVTAANSATGNQVTQYVYGSTLDDSDIASSLLKVAEIYPDSEGGDDQVAFTYSRQGEVTTVTDQNGTVHSYDYDLLGRRTQDRITTVGSGVDDAVLRIATIYEVRGMVETVTSFDNATVGMGSVVNEVQMAYNSFGQLTADYQAHSGAVDTGTTPVVHYDYADGSTNTIRPMTMIYPNGRELNFSYGSVGGMNDALSRIGSIVDNDGVSQLANYSYLGQSSIVEVDEPQPGLAYTLLGLIPGNDPDSGDQYQGLDRFGRVKDLIWTSSGNSSSSSSSSGPANVVERIQHGYDRAGNRLWRKELADANRLHDELYKYDSLYRLKDMQRGTLNSGANVISAENFAQCWGLDATGNWQDFREDDDGDGSWDLVQGRVSNPVNEISAVNNVVGPTWVTPEYDAAGNMTTMPQPARPDSGYTATYDAWNRLVTLFAGANQVAGYAYDGLKRRVVKKVYTGGVLDSTRHYLYSAQWQVLEERLDASTSADRQFVWGLRYVDDLVMRDRGGERLYGVQDPNCNLTAVVGASGSVVERYGYEAYGMGTVLTPGFGLRLASLWDWEVRYAGYRWDQESVLYQVRRRLYAAQFGLWLQRDPVGLILPLQLSLYQYCGSNPLDHNDPTGLFTPVLITFAGCAGAGVASGIANSINYYFGYVSGCEAIANTVCDALSGCFVGFLVSINPTWAKCLWGAAAGVISTLCKTGLHKLCDLIDQKCKTPPDFRCVVAQLLIQGVFGIIPCLLGNLADVSPYMHWDDKQAYKLFSTLIVEFLSKSGSAAACMFSEPGRP